MSKRGITLLEVMIYVVLALMAALAVGALFFLGRSAQKTTIAGYLVSSQTDSALRWIRRDLQETALVSLRTYPSPIHPNQPPGCAFVSARDASDKSPKLNISQYGKPFWNKNVFYSLLPDPDGRRGKLVRWENPLSEAEKDFVPRAPSALPNAFSNPSHRRVLLHQVLLPNQKVANLEGLPNYETGKHGGFRIEFVRRLGGSDGNQELSNIGPGDTNQPQNAANNTRLVSVNLEILSDDNHTRPSFYQIEFKICPRF